MENLLGDGACSDLNANRENSNDALSDTLEKGKEDASQEEETIQDQDSDVSVGVVTTGPSSTTEGFVVAIDESHEFQDEAVISETISEGKSLFQQYDEQSVLLHRQDPSEQQQEEDPTTQDQESSDESRNEHLYCSRFKF